MKMTTRVGTAMVAMVVMLAGCRREAAPAPTVAKPPAPPGSSSTGPAAAVPEGVVAPAAGQFPAVGSSFPGFKAPRIDGTVVDLATLKGKVVLVNLWATWCGPCQEEVPDLQALYEKNQAKGFEIAGVSVDSAGSEKAIADFVRIHKMTYPVYLDPDQRSTTLLHTSVLPTSVLLDRSGKVLWYHAGGIRAGDPDFNAALQKSLGS